MAGRGERREQILEVALRLIADRGYAGVSIDDIGEALGVTGPAIYRHFPGKAAILVALFDRSSTPLLEMAKAAEREPGATPRSVLGRLIRLHAEAVLDNTALHFLYLHDRFHLPADDARRIRTRLRAYGVIWRRALAGVRPELTDDEVLALEGAVIGVLQSPVYFPTKLNHDELCDHLERWAWQAVGAEPT